MANSRLHRPGPSPTTSPMPTTATRAGARHQTPFDLSTWIDARSLAVNRALDHFLPPEKTKPATIHKAMRYSIFAGGKRMRPALTLAAAEACGGREADALPLACAVECIHTYSLIHDDLPAMDNDDFRRGQPLASAAISKACVSSASPASTAMPSPKTLWLVGLPRRKSSLSIAGKSSWMRE